MLTALLAALTAPVTWAAGPPFTVHALEMGRIDPGASDPTRISYAGLDPGQPRSGPLLVLLGGTGSDPSGYRLFASEALRQGFHVLVLAYLDATSVGSLCRDDLACYGAVRQEMIDGDDASSLVHVSKADAIVTRLRRALAALAASYPTEGWGAYLGGDRIQWPRIVMAGFSQGAGHALWIAKHEPLEGLLLFSGPVDGRVDPPYRAARWITDGGSWATPRARIRAFVSTQDGYYPAIEKGLAALGLDPATGTSVEGGAPAPAGASVLVTHAASARAHASVIEDAATPRTPEGAAVYAPVWDALLTGW